ncbi:MAG: hypothetical protein OXU23_17085 [Candidatus Poribacteria bacterium]|nr:hypothetical protein [Candidatus Poribacteria bacterium]
MKINSTFHILVLLMAVLVFGMPFVTFAQQNSEQAQAMADAERDVTIDVNSELWFFGGCLGGIFVLVFSHIHEPSPPASRLLGKSPEYVAFYSDSYKAKAKNIQTSRAMAGCLTGAAVSCVGYSLLFLAAYDNNSYWY